MALDLIDVVGIIGGAAVCGTGLTLAAALLLDVDPSWPIYLLGAIVGAPIGYRYAESFWNWRRLWWRW